jgi:hypothetical protein
VDIRHTDDREKAGRRLCLRLRDRGRFEHYRHAEQRYRDDATPDAFHWLTFWVTVLARYQSHSPNAERQSHWPLHRGAARAMLESASILCRKLL